MARPTPAKCRCDPTSTPTNPRETAWKSDAMCVQLSSLVGLSFVGLCNKLFQLRSSSCKFLCQQSSEPNAGCTGSFALARLRVWLCLRLQRDHAALVRVAWASSQGNVLLAAG